MYSRLAALALLASMTGLLNAQDAAVISRGNMYFDAKAMDANGDGMISKDELMKYAQTQWERMARAVNVSIPVQEASHDFARGNLRFEAKSVDADGDGQISREEFIKHGEARFDGMKKDSHGMISVADISRSFGRGNQQVN
jgi:hypothetical protein